MKTYKELEREAHITGNTELAKLYAELDDVRHSVKAYKDRFADYDD